MRERGGGDKGRERERGLLQCLCENRTRSSKLVITWNTFKMTWHIHWTLADIYQMWVRQIHDMGKVMDLDRELAGGWCNFGWNLESCDWQRNWTGRENKDSRRVGIERKTVSCQLVGIHPYTKRRDSLGNFQPQRDPARNTGSTKNSDYRRREHKYSLRWALSG